MADALDGLRVALADRYTIDRELGHGGMATVYLADDLKHRRPVAIKVLSPEVAASLGSDRFLREIHTAAKLQHPHILPLLDSGDAQGVLYYVMPFVDGESLRDRLDREGPLPLSEALRVTAEIADALSYAHRHGVVHRDIKPGNILISGPREESGHALVTDFGIARVAFAATGGTLTRAGVAVGTPAYMSPEQASAERDVDGRADIYSLGCVLYEMLAGHPPFLGSTAQEILARHARDPVPPLRTARPELPKVVERLVRTALAKAPADRYPTAAAFHRALTATVQPSPTRRALRWALSATLSVGALTLGSLLMARGGRWEPEGSTAADSDLSIAVLPFENIGGDPSNEPFSDGVAEDLSTELRKVARLNVRARTSAFSFKGSNVPAQEVGKRLGVHYVVTGSVQLHGGWRRVNTQLTDVQTGNELWSEKYDSDASAENIFAVQDTITRSIVASLRVPLSASESARLDKRSTMDSEAHDLYLQGRYFLEKRDSVSLAKASDYFRRAIQVDPSYAQAYAGLSEAYSQSTLLRYIPRAVTYAKAKAAARKAVALDSTLVEAQAALGLVSLFLEWDLATAERAFDRAIRLDPRYAPVHVYRGFYFMAANRPDDAVNEVRMALRIDPVSPGINARLTSMLYFSRRYAEAIVQARRMLDLDSMFVSARGEYVRALLMTGRCTEATAFLETAPRQLGALFQGLVGYAYAHCGQRARAIAELDHLKAEAARGRFVSHYGLAMIHAGLDDKSAAFRELELALQDVDWTMLVLRVDPTFDTLRDDPRFTRIAAKVATVL